VPANRRHAKLAEAVALGGVAAQEVERHDVREHDQQDGGGKAAADGSWVETPWIQMPICLATGAIRRVATHESLTITTAFCLRALVAARAALEQWLE
jgi:hypothetical protein